MRNKSPGLLSGKPPYPTGTSVQGQDNATSAAESTYSGRRITELTTIGAAYATTVTDPSEDPGETAAPNSAASERLVGFLGLVVAGFVVVIAVM